MTIEYRPYRSGDEKALLALYNAVFARPMSGDQWQWAYRRNPIGRVDVIVACAGGVIVGQSAAIPLAAVHDGREIQTSRVQNVLVHADHRGRGIFTGTLSHLTALLAQRGSDFVLTYPNDNSLPGFMKLGGYQHVGDVREFAGTPGSAGTGEELPWDVQEPPAFSGDDVTFFRTALAPYRIFNLRSAPYLWWRYDAASGYPYRIVRLRREGRLVGIAVTKPYAAGHSVDLLEFVTDGSAAAARGLLRAILESYRSSAIDRITAWLMPHYTDYGTFMDLGFSATGRASHVVQRPLSERSSPHAGVVDSYYLSMGDSDVF